MKVFGAVLLCAAVLGFGAAPASAAITTDFAYSCDTDQFRFAVQDPLASGEDQQGFALAFVNAGAVDFTLLGDIASPEPVVLAGNTDDLGVRDVPVFVTDRIEVFFTTFDRTSGSEPTSAQLLGGTKVGSFSFCGTSTTRKTTLLGTQNSVSFAYGNWVGRASYDCWVNALYVSKSHPSPVPPQAAAGEVLIHKGRAVKTDLFQTFLPGNRLIGDLVPGLTKGDRIDVYAVPGAWLSETIGAFPRTEFAAKVVADPSAQPIYSFNYGMCGSISLPVRPVVPTVPPPAPVPASAPIPEPAKQNKKVTWPKGKGKAVTYKVRISKVGNTRAFGAWRSTGESRMATFTALLPGTYKIQVKAKPTAKPSKLHKTLTLTVR